MKKGFHQISIRLPLDILESLEKKTSITKRSMNLEIISILENDLLKNEDTLEHHLDKVIKLAEDAKYILKK